MLVMTIIMIHLDCHDIKFLVFKNFLNQHLKMGVEVIFSIFNLYWILLTFILGITFETHKLNIPNYKKRGLRM